MGSKIASNQNRETSYESRQVVAKFAKVGHFIDRGIQRTLWGCLTFWTGPLKAPKAGRFIGFARRDEEGFIRMEQLRPGLFLVEPGLIYEAIPVTGVVMAKHEQAMKKFRPRDLIETVKDDAPAVDLGVINMPVKKD